jgi:uncharacterized protein with HEPN domain
MLDAAVDAANLAAGRDRSDLDVDRGLTLALVKCVEIVGEAAQHVSFEAREQAEAIPWPSVINMRHRRVHAYYDINLDILWQTVVQELPSLIASLRELLRASS